MLQTLKKFYGPAFIRDGFYTGHDYFTVMGHGHDEILWYNGQQNVKAVLRDSDVNFAGFEHDDRRFPAFENRGAISVWHNLK